MKVLIAVDGSEGSLQATAFVGAMLTRDRDEVAFYYAPPEVDIPTEEMVERVHEMLADTVFEEAIQELPLPLRNGVQTIIGSEHTRQGIAAERHRVEEILRAIEDYEIDLVAIALEGEGKLHRQLMGSTLKTILTHAACSVLFVHEQEKS